MTKLPPPKNQTVDLIYRRYEEQEKGRLRQHLGMSQIGADCDRATWYSFRWAATETFDGRMLRLFERGRREEAWLIDDLRAVGVEIHEVDPESGKQFNFKDVGGHFGGSMDAAGVGFHEAPKQWHVVEFKTANTKDFKKLCELGVKAVKPQHYVQMQMYMGYAELDRAIYFSVCKETDEIYSERVEFDKHVFSSYRQLAKDLILTTEPPERINESADFYVCRMCRYRQVCHGEVMPHRSCRSCKNGYATEDGYWNCALHNRILSYSEQKEGCSEYAVRLSMAPASMQRVAGEFNGTIVSKGGT